MINTLLFYHKTVINAYSPAHLSSFLFPVKQTALYPDFLVLSLYSDIAYAGTVYIIVMTAISKMILFIFVPTGHCLFYSTITTFFPLPPLWCQSAVFCCFSWCFFWWVKYTLVSCPIISTRHSNVRSSTVLYCQGFGDWLLLLMGFPVHGEISSLRFVDFNNEKNGSIMIRSTVLYFLTVIRY